MATLLWSVNQPWVFVRTYFCHLQRIYSWVLDGWGSLLMVQLFWPSILKWLTTLSIIQKHFPRPCTYKQYDVVARIITHLFRLLHFVSLHVPSMSFGKRHKGPLSNLYGSKMDWPLKSCMYTVLHCYLFSLFSLWYVLSFPWRFHDGGMCDYLLPIASSCNLYIDICLISL